MMKYNTRTYKRVQEYNKLSKYRSILKDVKIREDRAIAKILKIIG